MVTPRAATNLKIDPVALEPLKLALEDGRAQLKKLAETMVPTRGVELVSRATDLVDAIIEQLSAAALDALERSVGRSGRSHAESVAIVAVGGYGRRELCPRSDIDLLFLLSRSRASENIAQYVNAILYGLWDLGFEVGHAVRTVEECVEMAQKDQAVKTGLLDARLLRGVTGQGEPIRQATFRDLTHAIERELLSGKGATELIEQKLDEAKRRRERFGNSIYLLEPNVKASEGGLRELHTALWVARARWRAVGIRDLLRFGVLSPREGRALDRAYGFLLRVRTELHHLANRRQDSLSFEYQELIANALGYVRGPFSEADKRKHGVERFMRKYYFHARQIRVLSDAIVERATSHPQAHPAHAALAPGGFKVWGGTLTVAERDQFQKDPGALVRIFRVAQEEALEIYSYTKDLIHGSADMIDAAARRSPSVVKDFLALLEDPKSDGSMLNVMHDLGILRRIMPEVARVTARWQHSLYHVYTVDIHSLFVVRNLKMLRSGGFSREQPELTRLIAELVRPNVVYMAAFLHDIGKGWPKHDHSKKGAEVALAIGRRFEAARIPNWTEEDTSDLVWLVREHLTMSDISQRRDVSDHDLIRTFAAGCGTVERLSMLYLLTFADMKGTSPKVWSDWKGTLLREVFEVTRTVLLGGAEAESGSQIEARRKRARLEILQEVRERGLKAPSEAVIQAFTEAMTPRYMLSIPARRLLRHIEMWRDVSERGGFAIHIRQLRREGTTKLTIVCPDRPGLLALLAGTLAANRLQILSAQIFSLDRMRLPAAPAERAAGPPAIDEGDLAASRRIGAALETPAGGDDGLTYDIVAAQGRAPSGSIAVDVLFLKDENGEICDDPERWARVRADLSLVMMGQGDVDKLLDARVRGSTLKQRIKPEVKTEIVIANEVSKTETVIDVFCQDRLGALYTIARAFAHAGLTISVAKISTQGDRVADGFYVTDAKTGTKIIDRERLEAIRSAVRAAIEDASPR
jgi:[protein-PII] uridylyltransferase